MIKNVADMTHNTFDKVWEMQVMEFFNYVVFTMNYNKWVEVETKKWQQTH